MSRKSRTETENNQNIVNIHTGSSVCCLVAQTCLTLLWLFCSIFSMDSVAHQAPLSMGFSRQEYWSGLPFPSLEGLPNPGTEPTSPASLLHSRQILYHWDTREMYGNKSMSFCSKCRMLVTARSLVFIWEQQHLQNAAGYQKGSKEGRAPVMKGTESGVYRTVSPQQGSIQLKISVVTRLRSPR